MTQLPQDLNAASSTSCIIDRLVTERIMHEAITERTSCLTFLQNGIVKLPVYTVYIYIYISSGPRDVLQQKNQEDVVEKFMFILQNHEPLPPSTKLSRGMGNC